MSENTSISGAAAALSRRFPGVDVTVCETVSDQGEPLLVEKTWRAGNRIGYTKRRPRSPGHDRLVEAQRDERVLRAAADDWHAETLGTYPKFYKWLWDRADRIEREAQR